jgi:hypothetical protein
MSQSWSIDERITDKERMGEIAPPFTPHERATCRAAAEAFYLDLREGSSDTT